MDGMGNEFLAKSIAEVRRNSYYGIRPGTKGAGTPEAFAEDAKPPVFHYEMMTATDSQAFYDQFYETTQVNAEDVFRIIPGKFAEALQWILDRKLLSWEGYVDPDGVSYDFKVTGEGVGRRIDPECYAAIPLQLRADLFTMIRAANIVSQKEAQGVKP